jgi:hypothetical protein
MGPCVSRSDVVAASLPLESLSMRPEVRHVPSFWPRPAETLSQIDTIPAAILKSGCMPKARLFKNTGNRLDLLAALFYNGKVAAGTFDEWVRSVLPDDEYCFALNGVSAWNEDLSDSVFDNVVRPVVRTLGTPTRGFDVYMFSGRYELTPFGIHSDSENSILIHLGPGVKTAFVWDRELYCESVSPLTCQLNNFKIDGLLSLARAYELKPGDLLYIPRGDFHVMASPAYSTTLGVIPNPATRASISVALMRELIARAKDAELDASFIPGLRTQDSLQEWLMNAGRELAAGDAILQELQDTLLGLASNGHLVPSPECLSPIRDFDCLLEVSPRYPVGLSKRLGRQKLFIRGRELSIAETQAIPRAVDRMSSGEPFTLADLSKILADNLTKEACGAVLDELVRRGAFRYARSY